MFGLFKRTVDDGKSSLSAGSLSACRSLSEISNGLDWTAEKLFSPNSPSLVDLSLGQAAGLYIENSRAALDAVDNPKKFSRQKPLKKLVRLSRRLSEINACLVDILPYDPIPKNKSLPLIHGAETLHLRPHFGIYRVVGGGFQELVVAEQAAIFETARATYMSRAHALELGIANPKHFWDEAPMANLADIAKRLRRDRDVLAGLSTLVPFAERDCPIGSRVRESMLDFTSNLERQLLELVGNEDVNHGMLSLQFSMPSDEDFVINIKITSPDKSAANIQICLKNPRPAYALMDKWNMDLCMKALVDWVNPPENGKLYSLKKKSFSTVQALFGHFARASHMSSLDSERVNFSIHVT